MIRGMARFMKEPKTAELRSAVSLVLVRNTPDTDDAFDMRLTPKFSSWAKVLAASGSSWGGESEDQQNELTHVFVIRRHPALDTPEKDWYVVHNNRLFRILDVQELDQRAFFWVLGTNDEGPLTSYTYDNTETPEDPHSVDSPEAEPAPADSSFPFWSS